LGRDHFDGDVDELGAGHGVIDMKIFNVHHAHVAGFCVRNDAVPVGSDGGDIGGGSADISWVIDKISTGGETDPVSFFFVGMDVTHGLYIRRFSSLWYSPRLMKKWGLFPFCRSILVTIGLTRCKNHLSSIPFCLFLFGGLGIGVPYLCLRI
jgi:hypothetical protein